MKEAGKIYEYVLQKATELKDTVRKAAQKEEVVNFYEYALQKGAELKDSVAAQFGG